MIKLSIIIPVYNTAQYLNKCLHSILDQNVDKSSYEIIIVNDGSLDNSQQIIDEFCSTYNNVSCITQKNQGQSVARNRAIEVATGEYIWFVDSDDWVETDSIEAITSEYNTSPDIIMISRVETNRRHSYNSPYTTSGHKILLSKHFEQGPVFYILKRDFVHKHNLRFVPGIYHEDSEIIPKFLYLAGSVRVIDRPLYHVYENPTSTTRSINSKKSYDLLIVSENLLKFKQTHIDNPSISKLFNYLISVDLNNALANIVRCDRDEQHKFNNTLYNNRHLFSVLKKSSLKYRIEYILFSLFPRHCVNVYKVLKKI